MSRRACVEPIFTGSRTALQEAREVLAAADIESHSTSPKRMDGVLKVSREEASAARAVLTRWYAAATTNTDAKAKAKAKAKATIEASAKGRIISAQEASFYFCPTCQATLSDGALRCPACGEFVGDAHAL